MDDTKLHDKYDVVRYEEVEWEKRYKVIDKVTGETIDNANGAGFTSRHAAWAAITYKEHARIRNERFDKIKAFKEYQDQERPKYFEELRKRANQVRKCAPRINEIFSLAAECEKIGIILPNSFTIDDANGQTYTYKFHIDKKCVEFLANEDQAFVFNLDTQKAVYPTKGFATKAEWIKAIEDAKAFVRNYGGAEEQFYKSFDTNLQIPKQRKTRNEPNDDKGL